MVIKMAENLFDFLGHFCIFIQILAFYALSATDHRPVSGLENDREQGAINHSGGTRLNPEEHFPHRILGDNLLGEGTAVAAAARKAKGFFRKSREGVSLLPEMLPGIVLVIGIMLLWNAIYKVIPLYNRAVR